MPIAAVQAENLNSAPLSMQSIANEAFSVAPYTRMLPDPDRVLTIDDVRDQFSDMAPVDKGGIYLGFQDSAYWFAFEMENTTKDDEYLFIEIGYPLLDQVSFYLFDDKTAEEPIIFYETGDIKPFNSRPVNHPNFIFPVTVKADTRYFVVVHVDTQSSTQVPINIYRPRTFILDNQIKSTFIGLSAGVMLVMAMFNFLIYFSIKDKSYLFLSATFGIFFVFQLSISGIAFQSIWPNSPKWNGISLAISSHIMAFFFYRFLGVFLNIKEMLPKALLPLKIVTGLAFINSILSFFLPYQILMIAAILNLLFCLFFSLYCGITILRKGYKPARNFILAFSAIMLGATIWSMNKFGIIEPFFLTEYAVHFGAVCCVSLLSLALADRIKTETIEKEIAQKIAIKHLEKYRNIYDNSLEGMFRLDSNQNILACNPAFADLIGTESEDELLQNISSLVGLIPAEIESQNMFHSLLEEKGHVFGFEARCKNLNGHEFWAAIFARRIKNKDGEFIEGSIVDISDKKESEQKLDYLACYDPLTGLLNRNGFETQLASSLEHTRNDDEHHAIMLLDIDQFKIVNDTSGHGTGDELLKQMGKFIKSLLREGDQLARFGGDEFAILLKKCPVKRAYEIGDRLRSEISDFQFHVNEKTFSCSVSIGIVPITDSESSMEKIFSLADMACYAAKDSGRNKVVVHNVDTGEITRRQDEMEIINILREAIKKDHLVLYKQAILALKPELEGDRYEILVRLNHEGNILPPGLFLPAAERYNIISLVDKWVVEAYFKWLSVHPEEMENLVQANINLSGQTIEENDFGEFLSNCFKKYKIPVSKICFEITETSAVTSLVETTEFLKEMRAQGLKFALDDFGSGFSSYSYLKMLPVDTVKIDGCFVKEILNDPFDLIMVKSITEIAHTIGLKVVAEFVENQEICDLLRSIDVDLAQGYHIDKPNPL